jgi:hypothetical protein
MRQALSIYEVLVDLEAVDDRPDDALKEVGQHEKRFCEEVEEIRVIAIARNAPAVDTNRHDCLAGDSDECNDVETLNCIGCH